MAPKPYLAPSLVALRGRVNVLWPHRDKASDGWIGNAAHAARVSDHNPDVRTGVVRAIDIDRDGVSTTAILQGTIGHPAVNYVIFDHKIYSRVRGFREHEYVGLNAHEHHIHVSILHTPEAENWRGLWLPGYGNEAPKPKNENEDDDMNTMILYYQDAPGAQEPSYQVCGNVLRRVSGSEVKALRDAGIKVVYIPLPANDLIWRLTKL